MFLPDRGTSCRAKLLWRSEGLGKLAVAATSLCSGGVSKRLVCLVHSVSGLGSLPFNPSLAEKSERGKVGGTGREGGTTEESRALPFSLYPFLSPSSPHYSSLGPSLHLSCSVGYFRI